MNHFLTKQRAILKVCLISLIERKKMYGLQYLKELKETFKPYGYVPKHSEIYKALHELTAEGIIYRIKKRRCPDREGFQEIIIYQFTEDGLEKGRVYKQMVRSDLERSLGIIRKVLKDNY
ncbi:Replication termination protein [Sporolactobacillus sp. THM7-7]|nr:Replication termination protein [Sporolactobacillus sp. THM7-7]